MKLRTMKKRESRADRWWVREEQRHKGRHSRWSDEVWETAWFTNRCIHMNQVA